MHVRVDGKEIAISGRFTRIARLKAEYYEWMSDPHEFIAGLKAAGAGADVFTFVQKVHERTPRYDFHLEWESSAVLSITTFEDWWKRQVNDKTRNMVRRAQKSGVDVRLAEFGDDLIKGIKGIYDESPLRQGKPFKHYGKSIETLKKDHISFVDRSQFIGAYHQDELIGFIKLVHDDEVSHLMHIISKIGHRDKAPTNALIAKAVEICAGRGVPYLHYADWSRRGLGDFKKHHAFEQLDVPRYFVPLNLRGKMILCMNIHHKTSDLLPKKWIDVLADLRSRWYAAKYNVRRV
jgi:hypothetical protein